MVVVPHDLDGLEETQTPGHVGEVVGGAVLLLHGPTLLLAPSPVARLALWAHLHVTASASPRNTG